VQATRFEPEKLILFTHFPPKNTKCDKSGSGDHVGSEALAKLIRENQPNLCVCSHIHEARGEDMLGETRVVNVGPAYDSNFVVVEVTDRKIDVKRIKI